MTTEVSSYASGMRVSGTLTDIESAANARALLDGRELLRREGFPAPPTRAIVWRLLVDAFETLDRLPDKERGFLSSGEKSAWPEIYRPAIERFATAASIYNDAQVMGNPSASRQIGMSQDDADWPVRVQLVIAEGAYDRMLLVLGWFRYVTGRRPRRDVEVAVALARGQPVRQVRRIMGKETSDAAIYSIKWKVITQIMEAIGARNGK